MKMKLVLIFLRVLDLTFFENQRTFIDFSLYWLYKPFNENFLRYVMEIMLIASRSYIDYNNALRVANLRLCNIKLSRQKSRISLCYEIEILA